MHRVLAALSTLHANILTRLGDHGAAIHWWRTARRAADESKDLEVRMMVRCEEAGFGLYGQRDLGTVLRLIEEAENIGGRSPSFWKADLAGSKAKALSLLGRHDEAKRALRTFVSWDGPDARAAIIPTLARSCHAARPTGPSRRTAVSRSSRDRTAGARRDT